MRLRQIATVAKYIENAENELKDILGLKVAFRDPGVKVFGLQNIVCPIGGEFFEVVSPVDENTSAGRFILKNGDMCGYMVIFQCEDALKYRKKLVSEGFKVIWTHDDDDYIATHFHPKCFNGVLVSIDSVPNENYLNKYCHWPPAGTNWKKLAKDNINYEGISSITISVDNPAEASESWIKALDIKQNNTNNFVNLKNSHIKFEEPTNNKYGLTKIEILSKIKQNTESHLNKLSENNFSAAGINISIK